MSESSATSSSQSSVQETHVSNERRYWRRQDGPISWWPWGLLPLIGLVLLYLWGAFITAPNIEEQVQDTVVSNLADKGFAGAGVAAAGQMVAVDVALPADEVAHARAVARSTRCDTWVGRLICPTDVDLEAQAIAQEVGTESAPIPAAQPVVPARPHDFRVVVDSNNARLMGEVPDEIARQRLVEAARARFDRVTDELVVTGEAATSQWPLAADRAVLVTSSFERGSASWQNAIFNAQGLVLAETKARVRTQFNNTTGAPALGALSLEVAKTSATCNEEFAAALSTSTINFTTGSATIDASSQSLLEALAQTANQCAGALLIEGHTDSVGNEDSNMALSQERATAVQNALSELGVANARLSAAGYGESQPIASNDDAAGRAQNRRIVIQIATAN